MNNREILVRYKWLMEEAWVLSQQAERVLRIGRPAGIAKQEITGMPRGTNDPTAAGIQAFDGYVKQLKIKADEIMKICGRFESVITMLKDDRDRTICRMYYGLGMTDEQISRRIHIARQVITDIRNKAIGKL